MDDESRKARIKRHFLENKKFYVGFTAGIGVAGISFLIMRGVASQSIGRDTVVTAERDIVVLGKRAVMNNVSYISSNRQGPPSWVIRCIETGEIFSSQNAAAIEMNLQKGHISQHLNGMRDHVQNYHFERICMAA